MPVSRQQWAMVFILMSGTLLATINQTLLSPALPAIMESLSVNATTVQWLVSGYALMEAVTIPLSAYLIGRFTMRQIFISGFVIFTAGSLLTWLAPSFPFMLAGRMFQAACTGMAMPMVFTVILLVFPKKMRGTAMGVINLVIGFAPAVGPAISGLVIDAIGWRSLFLCITILSGIVLAISLLGLRNSAAFERAPLDVPSVVLSTIGLTLLLYGLSTFADGADLLVTGALVAVGATLVAVYVRRQIHLDVPMLKMTILKARPYAVGACVVVAIQAALMGTGVITPLYVQDVLGQSPTVTGLVVLPGSLLGACGALLAGRLFDKLGVRRIVIPGAAMMLVGAAGLTTLGADSSLLYVTAVFTVQTMALQFTMVPLNTWGLNSLDNGVIQHAQALSNTMNQVAASFGTAMLVSVSALGALLAPAGDALGATFAGIHSAYCVTCGLLACTFVAMLILVRDKGQEQRS